MNEPTHDNEHDIPTLPAIADGNQWRVWCEHCQCWHWHGAGEGHRVAHCHNGNYPHGYILKLGEAEATS